MADNVTVRRWVQAILVLYIAVLGGAAIGAGVWSWRTAERAKAAKAVVHASLFWWHFDVSVETSIFLIVVCFGVLGGIVHSATSLASYIGNRRFTISWAPWYALRPLIAATLATLAYVVFRAGFLSTKADATDVNLFGVAALAGLAGLFSKQVINKLEDVMNVVFASKADAERTDKLQPISITGIAPDTTPAGTAVEVVIKGTGFGPGAKGLVNDDVREPLDRSEGSITVALTGADVATAGKLELKVCSVSGEVSDPAIFTVS